ncbi:outer membrane lipoprotein carrier protein LolA [Phaeobacter italicus]|jgi:outer membrane lipoprotein-sorting protein|uniref:Outer-membrane lipoprotein carrier protein n=1 Tax=Phaeobacter italicus TaxID=481446 RepID=A0A0H5D606_9RHOB|nr:outer membrane lipoprotein carrier protein LolA [Phaeobacter italicus]MEC8016302.1 outer membrane lipoprotein carrier protein LolA [Pseudomonadota bacterium]NKX41095.1 outer membrane lipoprotein carrier protein LolA [Rhodobacteraceae bacterium R_SAG2]MBO9443497.1 outer membrane lipoprotein carrier protein LolA [Phaeobacter italicus]MBY6045176.1 outer membrane lipoprotein carrier protein LolA [Phaeobacter italicus]MCA0857881.1 outer membrane lipoprotein carrier protein LolA [Phaeobacter ital
MKQIACALALTLCSSAAWAAEKLSLNEVSQYLNGITTAQAPFSQINDDGSLSTGKLYMHRPGKMRFEYDAPNSGVVIAGAGAVVIQDPKSNQPPETYPLKRTPLSLILARTVNLGQANMVVGHDFDGTSTIVRAQDPKNPEYGSIEMMFTDSPVELRKWVIHDGSGGKTTVILGGLETGVTLSSRLFNTSAPPSR